MLTLDLSLISLLRWLALKLVQPELVFDVENAHLLHLTSRLFVTLLGRWVGALED